MTTFHFFHEHRLDFRHNFHTFFWDRYHGVPGDDTTNRRHELRSDDSHIEITADLLREKMDFLRNRPQNDDRLDIYLKIVGTQRINIFRIALPSHVIDV